MLTTGLEITGTIGIGRNGIESKKTGWLSSGRWDRNLYHRLLPLDTFFLSLL